MQSSATGTETSRARRITGITTTVIVYLLVVLSVFVVIYYHRVLLLPASAPTNTNELTISSRHQKQQQQQQQSYHQQPDSSQHEQQEEEDGNQRIRIHHDHDGTNNNNTTSTSTSTFNTITTTHNNYKLINVGLVSSGTSSFQRVTTTMLGLRSAHSLVQWTRRSLQKQGRGILSKTNLTFNTNTTTTLPSFHNNKLVTFTLSSFLSSSSASSSSKNLLVTELEKYDSFGDIPFMAPHILSQARQPLLLQKSIVAGSRSSSSSSSGTSTNTTTSITLTKFLFISTNRTKESWVESMMKSPSKGGVAFRVFYDLPTCDAAAATATADSDDDDGNNNKNDANGGCVRNNHNNILRLKKLDPITSEQWGTVYDRHQQLLLDYGIPTIDLESTTPMKWKRLCKVLSQVREWSTTTSTSSTTVYTACEQHRINGTPWADANNTTKNKEVRKKKMETEVMARKRKRMRQSKKKK